MKSGCTTVVTQKNYELLPVLFNICWKIQLTCSNGHLHLIANVESVQDNSNIIITAEDGHLSNATSNHFFVPQMLKEPV